MYVYIKIYDVYFNLAVDTKIAKLKPPKFPIIQYYRDWGVRDCHTNIPIQYIV